jgi:hypothetical protein
VTGVRSGGFPDLWVGPTRREELGDTEVALRGWREKIVLSVLGRMASVLALDAPRAGGMRGAYEVGVNVRVQDILRLSLLRSSC